MAKTAAGKTVSALTIAPATATIAVGATTQFAATATYSDSSTATVTSAVTWTSSKPAVATINASGIAKGVAAGSTTITASLSGVSGTATVTVPVPTKTVAAIAVTPVNPNVSVGATQQLTATATYSDNSTANITTTATWTSANLAVATVNASGLVSAVAAGSTTVTASMGGVSGTTNVTVPAVVVKTVSSIAVTSPNSSVALGASQQLTATATYSDGSTANVSTTAAWSAANTFVASVGATGLLSGVAAGSTTVTATLGGVSGNLPFVVTIAPGTGVNVATAHFDATRSGLNAGEQSLSPANVSAKTFGKLFSYLVDGYVFGQPLLVSNLTVNGGVHNVVYAVTEYDSVYAFDADTYGSGAPLWKTSLLQTGDRPVTDDPLLQPYEGVTSTPVIDLTSNTIYVVSKQRLTNGSTTFRLNALDITTGAQKFGGPMTIQASVPGTNSESVNGVTSLSTSCIQRAALLLSNGTIYMGFGGCLHGWFLAYNATTLAQTAVFNSSPNLNGVGAYPAAGGVWMGGGGPAADSAGNIYIATGNGPWDGQTAWGDSILKFNPQLKVEDYFTPVGYQYMDCQDADLAAGGLLLIPGTGTTPTQALAGGKTGKLYLVSTTSLGKQQPNDAGATQTLYFDLNLSAPYSSSCTDSTGTYTTDVNSYEIFGTAAYFNGSVYLGVSPTLPNIPAGIRQFTYAGGVLTPGPETSPSVLQHTHGTTPFISANGTTNGVLWMIDHGQPIRSTVATASSAILRAYDANNLTDELYNSSTNAADVPGYGIKFSAPIVANGKAYIATAHDLRTVTNPQGEIDVYGLK